MCSGRSHCELSVADNLGENIKPCPKDVMSYLESKHECITGNRLGIYYVITVKSCAYTCSCILPDYTPFLII